MVNEGAQGSSVAAVGVARAGQGVGGARVIGPEPRPERQLKPVVVEPPTLDLVAICQIYSNLCISQCLSIIVKFSSIMTIVEKIDK